MTYIRQILPAVIWTLIRRSLGRLTSSTCFEGVVAIRMGKAWDLLFVFFVCIYNAVYGPQNIWEQLGHKSCH